MKKSQKKAMQVGIATLSIAAVAVGAYLFQPWRLFTNTFVDEALPAVSQVEQTEEPGQEQVPAVTETAGDDSSLMIDERSSESEPAPEAEAEPVFPITVLAGDLISHEYETTGEVKIIEQADGSRVLRFEGLDTSDGPDLHVWLTDAPVLEGVPGWRVFDDGLFVDLGELKGNQGNQNYLIPDEIDLDDYSSVSIWCVRFAVSFGAADLS